MVNKQTKKKEIIIFHKNKKKINFSVVSYSVIIIVLVYLFFFRNKSYFLFKPIPKRMHVIYSFKRFERKQKKKKTNY